MRFLVLMLTVGACALILNTADKTEANPQGGSQCTIGACLQGEICCDGQFLCPKSGSCKVPAPGSGSFGGIVGTCLKMGKCTKEQQCCAKAMKCPKTGFCPKAKPSR